MNKRIVLFFSIVFFLCCSLSAQTFYQWNEDSIRIGLQRMFPRATSIQLINSEREVPKDTLVSGWAAKAAVLDEGDSNKIFFYFFTIRDTSDIRRIMVASLNSMVTAAQDTTNSNYVFSLPFIDSSGIRAIMYYAAPKSDTGYYFALEQELCRSFRVPNYRANLKIDVHIAEVKQDARGELPPPPPPSNPQKKKQRS